MYDQLSEVPPASGKANRGGRSLKGHDSHK